MSIRPDQIPPEAVEAAARAMAQSEGHPPALMWEVFVDEARAAIAAALAAWPGMHHYIPNAEPYYGKHIILPLQEPKT